MDRVYKTRLMAVYAIVHKPSGRVYIGGSTHVSRRWSYHRIVLRKHIHENPNLQACWDASRPSDFAWRILETVEDESQLISREQHWMDTLGAIDPLRVFNILPTAGSFRGRTLTDEHKRKISAKSKGHLVSPEQRAKIAAKAMGNHRGVDNLTRFRETRMLSADTVADIRRCLASGCPTSEAVIRFNLPHHTIYRIAAGLCYPKVMPELIPLIKAARPEWRRGEQSAKAKLSDDTVRNVMQRLANGESMVAIGRDLGVTPGAISQIKHGRAWTHVTQPASFAKSTNSGNG